jgi:hypothetical protein
MGVKTLDRYTNVNSTLTPKIFFFATPTPTPTPKNFNFVTPILTPTPPESESGYRSPMQGTILKRYPMRVSIDPQELLYESTHRSSRDILWVPHIIALEDLRTPSQDSS